MKSKISSNVLGILIRDNVYSSERPIFMNLKENKHLFNREIQ